jgi:RsiW-degrading membrane proteinase PrsW (M82 family)
VLRWLLPASVPVALFALLLRAVGGRREPHAQVISTFVLGGGLAAIALVVTRHAALLTGLDVRASEAGPSGALVFVVCVVAPIHEAAKVAAAWAAFASKHAEEPYDGVVYGAAAALGFAAVETAIELRAGPGGVLPAVQALLALPAHVFFACVWGYALGRAKHARGRFPAFPVAFVAAVLGHGLYHYFVYSRGPGAILAVLPLLAAMGAIAWFLVRDLRFRDASLLPPEASMPSSRLARLAPPSLAAVRAALKSGDEPIRIGWIAFGSLVILGGMLAGVAAGVVLARVLHVDLSIVDERDVAAGAPALFLGAGLLASFPASGWLIARAAGVRSLLEPALSTVLALGITLLTLGMTAPFTVVFGLALSPFAWLLSCFGAWMGRDG